MKIYLAKNYSSREDLERDFAKDFSLDVEKKDAQIKGKKEELKKLHLSARNEFWGAKVVETNFKSSKGKKERPIRGEIHKGFINSDNSNVKI